MVNDPSQEQDHAGPTDRRRESSRIRQIQRRRRVAFGAIGVMLLLVLGILFAGYVFIFVRPPQERVVSVNEVTYTRGDMVKMLRIRQRLQEDQGQRLDTSSDIFQALQLIVENEIIAQSAPSLGITVSDEEVDTQIQATIIFQAGPQLAGKSEDQLDREFKELYSNFLNASQISEDEHRDIVRRTLLRSKVRQYVGESVPNVAKQYHVYRLAVGQEDEIDILFTKYDDYVKNSADPVILHEAFKAITREFSREAPELVRRGGEIGWVPLGVLEDYDDVIATVEVGELSTPIPNRDQRQQAFIFMVSEIDELRELDPVNHEALKTRALERWINEQRREHDVYAVFNSDIYAWMIQQLGISTAITPSPQPASPFQQFLGGS
ncbi:MAG: SurA N-terminal domain-containing protein [Chloroflexota bacterium]|nr:SurA N-terminal domain-containing protein [Chloroflexota bacterium]MDE2686757.1 SurA N-terminal domain-containing protein [Chloroflexota bacterium]